MRRSSRNPITIELQLGATRAERDALDQAERAGPIVKKHLDFFCSPKARAVILDKGREVVPDIRVIFSTGPVSAEVESLHRKRGTITLFIDVIDAARSALKAEALGRRDLKASLHTAHVLLHRLGDGIFMHQVLVDLTHDLKPFVAYPSYYPGPLLGLHSLFFRAGVKCPGDWLPAIVDTKACRDGYVKSGSQALAELVPHLLLYPKGRTEGIRFRPVSASLVPDAGWRRHINESLREAEAGMTTYIRKEVKKMQDNGTVLYL